MTNTTNNVSTKKGFTMIELIFVIVIIGILAAVAIPRLAATRDDAKVATSLSEAGMILREMSTYYTANGHFEIDPAKMSNITDLNKTSGALADLDNGTGVVFSYYTKKNGSGTEKCIDYTLSNTDGNITISAVSGAHQNVCSGVLASGTFKEIEKTHIVGGSNISF